MRLGPPWPPGIGDPNGPLQPMPGGNPFREHPLPRVGDAPSPRRAPAPDTVEPGVAPADPRRERPPGSG